MIQRSHKGDSSAEHLTRAVRWKTPKSRHTHQIIVCFASLAHFTLLIVLTLAGTSEENEWSKWKDQGVSEPVELVLTDVKTSCGQKWSRANDANQTLILCCMPNWTGLQILIYLIYIHVYRTERPWIEIEERFPCPRLQCHPRRLSASNISSIATPHDSFAMLGSGNMRIWRRI